MYVFIFQFRVRRRLAGGGVYVCVYVCVKPSTGTRSSSSGCPLALCPKISEVSDLADRSRTSLSTVSSRRQLRPGSCCAAIPRLCRLTAPSTPAISPPHRNYRRVVLAPAILEPCRLIVPAGNAPAAGGMGEGPNWWMASLFRSSGCLIGLNWPITVHGCTRVRGSFIHKSIRSCICLMHAYLCVYILDVCMFVDVCIFYVCMCTFIRLSVAC
jgi:hypothetical protein